jgi:transposase
MPWSHGKSRLSLAFIVVLSTFARILSWEEVARLFGVHWNTVKSSVSHSVEYGLSRRDLSGILKIGIDELSRRKGHTYITNVYDLVSKNLIWTGDGRDSAVLEKFFDEYGNERTAKLKGVCCDMWAPYFEVIDKSAPKALLVFDKFHIVRHLVDAVDKVRKIEALEKKKDNPELLDGTKYIWLKNPWNLTPKQRERLGLLEKLNLKINRAYLLKESFRQFWDYVYPESARKFLNKWFWWATHSRLVPMRDFAWMLRNHEDDILNFFKLKINAGIVEGLNRKAKVISQRAYGYRTFETFRLALYHVMANLPMPELTHKFV